jgi:hypothetical protein
VPVPNAGASVCLVLDVQTDAVGTATCNGDVDLDLPLRMNVFVNGDVFTAPDVPGVQPCPICVQQCVGGVSDQFPCTDDSDCVAGFCGASTNCMGGPNDGLACTPGSTDLGDSYRTSHDCPSDPLMEITPTGGIVLDLALTTGQVTANAVDLPFPGISRSFCGAAQATSGAFTEFEATQVSLTGTPAPPSLGGDSRLVTSFCVPATDSVIVNAAGDLPGPGAVMLLGEVSVSP